MQDESSRRQALRAGRAGEVYRSLKRYGTAISIRDPAGLPLPLAGRLRLTRKGRKLVLDCEESAAANVRERTR